jgi:CMP-N-acetylneuraminic acid synthetase
MKIVAYIPIKTNNRRLPGKNTKEFFDGTPLINLIQVTLQKISLIDKVYVYCSNENIKKYLINGVEFIKRPESLDLDTTPMNNVLLQFAKTIEADFYVLAHATAPFIECASIEDGLKKVISGKYDSAFSTLMIQDFLWKDGKSYNYRLDSIPRTQDLEPLFIETTGLYIYPRHLILNDNVRIGSSPYLIPVSKIEAIDINQPEDFNIANAIYRDKLFKKSKKSK